MVLGRVRLVRTRGARRQGVIPEDRCPELFPTFEPVLIRRVQPHQGGVPAPYHMRQGFMHRVKVLEHIVHGVGTEGAVGVLLGRAQPRRQGGLRPARR